jgi:hypothetical protein
MDIPRAQTGFPRHEADAIVAEAARGYFEGCRARIDAFVEHKFSVAGAARLHTRAVGWDLLKAPANVVLSVPQIGMMLGAAAARSAEDGAGPRQSSPVARNRGGQRAPLAADDRAALSALRGRRPGFER